MEWEKYDQFRVSRDSLEFIFESVGPKGIITMIVQFKPTDDPEIYNLAFGNVLSDGKMDDHTRNGNKDRNKIMATVADMVYEFTAKYPDKYVFFKGSTPGRTRLYRMALSLNFSLLSIDLEIYGVVPEEDSYGMEPFRKNEEYYGFVVKRKRVNFIL